MIAIGSASKGKEKVQQVVIENEDEDGESDSWIGDEEDDDSEGVEEESETDDEDYGDEEFNSEESSKEDEDEDQTVEDDDGNACDRKEGKAEENELTDKVVSLLRQSVTGSSVEILLSDGNKKLDVLKLEECKAYLRKHELMISGTKAACIQRIIEHWRLKDGSGLRLYPMSSFTINCTGDACKGDVVMFKQRVYERFDKVSRRGKFLGKRTVAGRIVKESYGVAKQQHTFTVEVLWSKGVKSLPPLCTLLVKGRNLYRYRTFRQGWRNETERRKILDEKHGRGAQARHIRASNETRNYAGSKRQRNPSISRKHPNKGQKKDSKSIPRKKQKETSNSGVGVNIYSSISASASLSRVAKKHGAKASPSAAKSRKSKAMIKKHGTKASSSIARSKAPSSPNLRQANHHETAVDPHHKFSQRPTIRTIYDDSRSHLHQRNNMAVGPQTGRERFHAPGYNYDHNAGHAVHLMQEPRHHQMMIERTNHFIRPYEVHASQFDLRESSGHPYSTSVSQYGSRSSGHFFTPAIHDYSIPWR